MINNIFKKFWAFINNNYNGLLVIITFFGVIIVWGEFKELKRQNEINEARIRQGIGAFLRIIPSNIYMDPEDSNSIIFHKKLKLKNSGKSILYLNDPLSFYSNKPLDFRSISLADYITKEYISISKVDEISTISLNYPLFPDDTSEAVVYWPNMKSQKDYYFYSALFYRDQYNNFYHSIIFYSLNYEKPYVLGMGTPSSGYDAFYYHPYTQDEEKYLIEKIKLIDTQFADILGKTF